MVQPHDPTTEERLTRLEGLVEEILRRLPDAAASRPPAARAPAYAAPEPPAHAGAASPHASREWTDAPPGPRRYPGAPTIRLDGQFWLNKLGIGLLLLGVALLFRYSIEQGWVTPGRRVSFGLAVGVALLVAGLRMDERQRRFVPVLLGGSVATFYIVGFAAFLLYGLIGYGLAFTGMVAVTVLAYGLALHRREATLALLAALGGLGTPLVLGIDHATPRGTALYVSLILGWTCALHLMRGWRSVLWTSLLGGWLLLLLYADLASVESALGIASFRVLAPERWAMQGAVAFAWVTCGVLPFIRELRLRAGSARGDGSSEADEAWSEGTVFHWHGLALLPPLAALLATAILWQPSPTRWGGVTLASAGAYQLASMALQARDGQLARVLTLSASVFLAMGSVAALSGEALLLALAAEAAALLLLARRYYGPALAAVGHMLFAFAGIWMVARLVAGPALGDRAPLVDLAVIGTALAISYLAERRGEMLGYRYFAHVSLLGWLWRELASLPGGEAYASVSWGAYAVVLLVLAMRARSTLLERTAVVTLLVVTAKLFLVDLAALEAIWRVLLFVGIGGAFLFLSYALQTWRRSQPTEEAERSAPAGR